jgi:hypothetical protein
VVWGCGRRGRGCPADLRGLPLAQQTLEGLTSDEPAPATLDASQATEEQQSVGVLVWDGKSLRALGQADRVVCAGNAFAHRTPPVSVSDRTASAIPFAR